MTGADFQKLKKVENMHLGSITERQIWLPKL